MLTDTKLRNLKTTGEMYKVADRDGMYVAVTAGGAVSFRFNYRINGRQETLTLGRYGSGGITLAEARALLADARRKIAEGQSPAQEKARDKAKDKTSQTFGHWADSWLRGHQMADSTRDMRRATYNRELKAKFGNRLLKEITHDDLRALTDSIVERGAPATAVHAREIVLLAYRWAAERGQRVENPAEMVRPASIATFQPRDRSLSPEEVGLFYEYLNKVAGGPQFKAACKLVLLTMVRKGEFTNAKWTEFNFTDAVWSIPKARMKMRAPHLVFLSRQAMDLLVALKTFAGGSEYVVPSRYDTAQPMSNATLNRILDQVWRAAQADGKTLEKFGPHDLRRTASTLLHEAGYNTDWIEKCLAHEQRGVRAVYNKAEYREQRIGLMQDWADMIDSWTIKPQSE